MKIRIGYSPCPNDTFIFDAMVHGKIDTQGLEFEAILADVEELNQRAFRAELEVTKLSYHAYAYVAGAYQLLDAGSALGNNCGPLLIARQPIPEIKIPDCRIAIPGRYTTANFLLSLAFPMAKKKKEMLFSDIEDAVLEGTADAGLIIHENRFTYQDKGLVKLLDLGEFWESTTGFPIPLGGIAVRRNLPLAVREQINRVMAASVAFALDNPDQTYDYVRQHAQEMDREVMFKHIALYVNDFTRNLGSRGRQAVAHLFQLAEANSIIPPISKNLFLTS